MEDSQSVAELAETGEAIGENVGLRTELIGMRFDLITNERDFRQPSLSRPPVASAVESARDCHMLRVARP